MSKITSQTDCSNLTTIDDLSRFLSVFQRSAIGVVNGNIEFDTNLKTSTVTATLQNGTQVQIPHTLGRVPIGYILAGSNAAVRVYNTKGSDSQYIYPIGDAVASVTLIVF